MTPGGSRGNSKPNSRPLSRSGSRHGSNLSLNSNGKFPHWPLYLIIYTKKFTDDGTQTRIPTRRIITSTPSRPARLSVGSATKANGTPTSGTASPAPQR